MAFALAFYWEHSTKIKRYSEYCQLIQHYETGVGSSHEARTQFNTNLLAYKAIVNILSLEASTSRCYCLACIVRILSYFECKMFFYII